MVQVLKGNIVQAPALGELQITEQGYLVLEDGVIRGVYDRLPLEYATAPLVDYGQALVMQSFADMHLHAPQYPMLGMGMDLPLLEWLDTYTFPTEARFRRHGLRPADLPPPGGGADRQRHHPGVSCSPPSTPTPRWILMEELERAGVTGYVGKVNMDRNGVPGILQETTEESVRETLRWLEGCHFDHVKPILTPRFTPSCTDELMAALGRLAAGDGAAGPVSPVGKSRGDRSGYRSCTRTVSSTGRPMRSTACGSRAHHHGPLRTQRPAGARRHARGTGVVAVHCAGSNVNLCSGTAPVRRDAGGGVSGWRWDPTWPAAPACPCIRWLITTPSGPPRSSAWRPAGAEDFLDGAGGLLSGLPAAGHRYFGGRGRLRPRQSSPRHRGG